MSLVFRSDQTTPLTNDQLDNNFKYLRDQTALKYSTSSVTAANISAALRTAVGNQTSLDLAQSNALNAWTVRDLAPNSILPLTTDKSSIVTRASNGDITVSIVHGNLDGNATTASLAANATKLLNSRTINGVAFDGTANISIEDSSKLPLLGGQLVGKLLLKASSNNVASINFGASAVDPDFVNRANGDMWATTSGVYYHIQGQTDKVAPIASPSFTGIPQAPGTNGAASQVITLSHLDVAKTELNSSISLKANIASPAFTGNPTVPTAAVGDNDTSIANTAFVTAADNAKEASITSAYQTYTTNAIVTYSNTVNTLLTAKANLASPVFTGIPQAPTAAAGTNSTQLATTAFTNSAVTDLRNILNAAITSLNDAIASTRPVPVGAVFYMAQSVVQYGYLEANGQAVSRTTYADLWTYLGRPNTGDGSTTFNVPDYRGEFFRGWDHGRGIDTNRAIGTVQYGSIQSHTHPYVDTYYREAWGDQSTSYGVGSAKTDSDNYDYNYNRVTSPTGDNETRPRNVALMPVIKW
jgi:microcystin-dependent protein